MSSAAISVAYQSSWVGALGPRSAVSYIRDSTPVVVVLDSDVCARESLELLIRSAGWQCETFVSSEEFFAHPPPRVANCLMLDAASCADALDVQKRVALECPSTAIILMANSIEVATAVKAIKAGAVELFSKPCPEESLLTSIREALERSQLSLTHETEIRTHGERYSPNDAQPAILGNFARRTSWRTSTQPRQLVRILRRTNLKKS